MAFGQPAAVMAGYPVAMADGKGNFIEPVKRQRGFEPGLAIPGRRQLLVIAPVFPLAAPRLRQCLRWLLPGRVGLRHSDLKRIGADALQVALAEQGGAIAAGP